jgi:hypothetical protein
MDSTLITARGVAGGVGGLGGVGGVVSATADEESKAAVTTSQGSKELNFGIRVFISISG